MSTQFHGTAEEIQHKLIAGQGITIGSDYTISAFRSTTNPDLATANGLYFIPAGKYTMPNGSQECAIMLVAKGDVGGGTGVRQFLLLGDATYGRFQYPTGTWSEWSSGDLGKLLAGGAINGLRLISDADLEQLHTLMRGTDVYQAEDASISAGCTVKELADGLGSYVDGIGNIGDGSIDSIIFTVKTDVAGARNMDIYYVASEDRTLNIDIHGGGTVNGATNENVLCAGATGNAVKKVTVTVDLVAGNNTIILGNSNGPAPGIARIEIEKSVDGKGGKDGVSPIVSTSKNGTVTTITIKDAEGTKTATINDGAPGATPDISIGTVRTLAQIEEATASITGTPEKPVLNLGIPRGAVGPAGSNGKDGYTPVKGKDYWTDADLQAIKDDCILKNQGSENVGKILVVGTDGNFTLTDMPEGGASGDVIGTLDESNNILLVGNLADGTYTLKYENADGTYTEIGSLVVGAVEPEVPSYTNQIPLSTEADGTPFNGGKGYKTGARLNSAGGEDTSASYANTEVVGFIPFTINDTIYIKGIATTTNHYVVVYDSSHNKVYAWGLNNFVTLDGSLVSFDIKAKANEVLTVEKQASIAYMRLAADSIDDNSIITINEEIV